MNTAQAFHITEEEALETEALRELNAFLARPNSIGLDNLKESLRNMVQLMMEIKGYSTGYAIHHLVLGEHSSLALAGILKGDAEKKRRLEELENIMKEFERLMFMEFSRLFTHVQTRINVISENIENRINKLDETIENAVEDGLDARIVNQKRKKRSRLKTFMQRIKEREKQLQNVDTTEEIIEVEANLTRDIDDLRHGENEPQPEKESAFSFIRKIFERRRENSKYSYDKRTDGHGEGNGETSTDDTDEGTTGSGEKEKDEDIEPPHTPDF